jgi:nitroimidazol reductase NimA-like FMN-containing flavoprotein (pyridoxamine 5'-phosphate oxidase superfamily)
LGGHFAILHTVNADDLAHPGAEEILRHASLARLAYSGLDGTPRVVPVGFHWNGEEVVVCTATTAPKVAALRSRPAVALTIDTADTPSTAKALLIRGNAEIDIVEGVAEEYLDASAVQDAEREAFEARVRETYERMARIVITPHWARFYDFGAGRLPPFLQELVDGAS